VIKALVVEARENPAQQRDMSAYLDLPTDRKKWAVSQYVKITDAVKARQVSIRF
jgi:hypothetical protein